MALVVPSFASLVRFPRPLWSLRLVALALIGLAAPACGGGDEEEGARDGGSDGSVVQATGRFLPLKVGAQWKYKVMTNAETETKTTKVEALEPVPGKPTVMGYRVVTTKGTDQNDRTVSWQEDTGTTVVRHVEDSYRPGVPLASGRESWEPYKMRLDERPEKLKANTTWMVEYMETNRPSNALPETQKRVETWTILSVAETVTIQGKTYPNCLKVRRVGTDMGASSDKTYWYARGIGKIKESGGQIEELIEVTGL